MSEINPGSREEMYLDAINSQLDGEAVDTEHMIEPGSRKERYLSEIAKKIASTIELPAVTSADNGDVLTVKNGKWDKGDAPSGLPSVTSGADDYKVLTAIEGAWIKHPACFTTVYTITGLPVDGVYPLSTEVPLADILDAIGKGANVCATLTVGGDTAIMHPASMGSNYVGFSNVVYWSNAWVIFCINHYIDANDNEVCEGHIVPISTVQMTYNSTTGALSMTNVPEENA